MFTFDLASWTKSNLLFFFIVSSMYHYAPDSHSHTHTGEAAKYLSSQYKKKEKLLFSIFFLTSSWQKRARQNTSIYRYFHFICYHHGSCNLYAEGIVCTVAVLKDNSRIWKRRQNKKVLLIFLPFQHIFFFNFPNFLGSAPSWPIYSIYYSNLIFLFTFPHIRNAKLNFTLDVLFPF